MSTENPVISNFDGLGMLEELASRLVLDVRSALAAEPDRLAPSDLIRLAAHDIRRLALTLRADWSSDEVDAAVRAARLDLDDVVFAVTVEDRFLKERVLVSGPLPICAVPVATRLADYSGDRPVAMKNTEFGFAITAHIALARAVEPIARRPHRMGTILARSDFRVLPTADTGGLDPRPLTADIIAANKLSPRTVLYVAYEDDLVPATQIADNLAVYVHEALLAAASHQRSVERDAVISGLAIEALCQIVHVVSAELKSGAVSVPDGEGSAVLRLLRRNLRTAGLAVDEDTLVELLRDEPNRVAGLLSGLDRRAARFLQIVEGDESAPEPAP